MGKRKSSRKIVKKERPKLDTTFACLFCNHESTISVSMDKDRRVGNLKCRICSASYQAAINHLSKPVDVYSEWIDACEEAKLREMAAVSSNNDSLVTADRYSRNAPAGNGRDGGGRGRHSDKYEDDDDGEAEDGYYAQDSRQAALYDHDEHGIPEHLDNDSDEIDDF
ncbi:hypothetical protein J3B02_000827 [Coemansia erecta]|uniref:Transcription elongation factor 1 homolog n=1 Tax=Coemansia asiatica TaxID=1052880 RepID=A0A9W7XLT5_9FUNG|nr:hypothetical protein LPJ64_003393 [Coemansia asiatica]KAJ2857699.1 hypothetical protein J3B02_000827 [Coemansia erecta]KAJ2888321.1 hypothetical protein FB639_000714 [Coemansia asiatica]